MTFYKSDLETVISPKVWAIDNVLSALLMLLYQGTVFLLDTAFVKCYANLLVSSL